MIGIILSAVQQESDFWSVEHFPLPPGEVIEVGGMDFGADGALWLATRRGQVWRVADPLSNDPGAAPWTLFAEGLYEGLGLNWVDGRLLVLQRCELSELLDHDRDGACDEVRTITQDWGMSGNYHEFAYGLPDDRDGNLWLSLNVGFWSPEWWHGLSRAPCRGWILRVSPEGAVTPVACGARSPCGLGIGPAGDVFYTDNQGDWMPVCPIFHVEEGDFFGHPASLRWTEEYGNGERIPSSTEPPARPRKPAAALIPYKWSRSAVNLLMDGSGGRFGPFAGQMIVGELTNGMLLRVEMEKVHGAWQGVVWPLRQEVGSICRIAQAEDGSLLCGFTNRGWGGLSPGHGLARVRWTGRTPFEVASASARPDGFLLRFTRPLAAASATATAARVVQYDYYDWWDYGSPQQNVAEVPVAALEAAADGMSAFLRIPGLQPARCAEVVLAGLRSADGEPLLHPEFHATLNQLPGRPRTAETVMRRVQPPSGRSENPEGWLHLTWADPLSLWEGGGWRLCDADLDPADRRKFATRDGSGALVNTGPGASDLRTRAAFGDCEFRFQFLLPERGDSGLYFQDRYELQLVDDAGQCGGINDLKNPRQSGYRGAGRWHVVTGRFRAPRFDEAGRKIAHARFEEVALDGTVVVPAAEAENGPTGGGASGETEFAPLRFQGTAGSVALGDVRVKPLQDALGEAGWAPLLAEPRSIAPGIAHALDLPVGAANLSLRCTVTARGTGGYLDLIAEDGEPLTLLIGQDGARFSGSLSGRAEAPLRVQLIPDQVSCRMALQVLQSGARREVAVFVNGVEFARAALPAGSGPLRRVLLRAAPDGGFDLRSLEHRAER